jgi:hypothetical protein
MFPSTSARLYNLYLRYTCTSVADSHHIDADTDPDPAYHFDADPDPDPDPSFQIKAQNHEKVLKQALIPYILACHLKIYAIPHPAFHFVADTDPAITLMRMRIRIQIHNTDLYDQTVS